MGTKGDVPLLFHPSGVSLALAEDARPLPAVSLETVQQHVCGGRSSCCRRGFPSFSILALCFFPVPVTRCFIGGGGVIFADRSAQQSLASPSHGFRKLQPVPGSGESGGGRKGGGAKQRAFCGNAYIFPS